MEKNAKVRTRYSEEFKLSVLKDMYENNLTLYGATKKHGLVCQMTVGRWAKQYPIDSKSLSLSDEVIARVKAMRKKSKGTAPDTRTREEQLAQEVETLRKALAYSELRNEALHEVLKIGKEQYGIDLLKKAGAKQ